MIKSKQVWWLFFARYPGLTTLLSLFWLIALAFIAFIWHLGDTGLVDETEPLFAEAARQMTVTGDWLTPYYNDATRFDKPPLIYWLMAIAYQVIGVNEWAVRLPSAIAAIALMSFTFITLRHFGFATPASAKAYYRLSNQVSVAQLWLSACLGAGFFALNMQVLIWARTGVSDMLLSSCLGGALFCFFWGYVTGEKKNISRQKANFWQNFQVYCHFPRSWYLGFYICLAGAVLTKGPVGIVLPGLIILSFLFYLGNFSQVAQEIGLIWGIIIFLCLTLPWFILIFLEHGDTYINSFFGYHNIARFTGVVNNHSAPWYFYFLIVLGLYFPWSTYLPAALGRINCLKRSFWQKQPRYSQLGLFAWFWFIIVFLFFTIAVTKLPSYTLPLVPAAAILVSLCWSDWLTTSSRNQAKKYSVIVTIAFQILLTIIIAIAFYYLPSFLKKEAVLGDLSQLLTQSQILLKATIIWLTTAIILIILLATRPKQYHGILVVNFLAFILFLFLVIMPVNFLLDNVRQLPIRQISQTIVQKQLPGEKVWMVGFEQPTLVFYSKNSVKFFKNHHKLLEYHFAFNNPASKQENLLIVIKPRYIKKLGLKKQDYQLLDSRGSYNLIRVKRVKLTEVSK